MRLLSIAAGMFVALNSGVRAQESDAPDLRVARYAEPADLASPQEASESLNRARGLFAQARRMYNGEAQRRLYRDSARAFLHAADELPERAAPLTERAASALQRAGLPAAAAGIFQGNVVRIRQSFEGGAPDPNRYALLAYSMFFVAFNHGRALDYDGSLDAYAALLEEPLLSESDDPRVASLFAAAAFNRALTLDWLHRYAEARAAYRAAVELQTDDELRRAAEYGVQRMVAKRGPARAEGRVLLRFAQRHANEAEYARFVAIALLHAANAFRDAGLFEREQRALQTLAEREPSGNELRLIQFAVERRAQEPQPGQAPTLPMWGPPAIAD